MSGYRVVFVTRRFWPVWDGESRAIGAIAASLVQRGWRATVVTTQPCLSWPSEFVWRGVSVVRLASDRAGRASESRYLRSLGRWFREHGGQYDLACVSGLRHEAFAVIRAVDGRMPVVLRGKSVGRHGDCLWHLDVRGGRRIKRRTMKAAAWIGTSGLAHRELIAAGYPRERTYHIAQGVPTRPARERRSQTAARRELAADHPTLMLAEQTPLAVFVGRLESRRGLMPLIAAWERVVEDRPKARLWLVGHGAERGAMQERIDGRGLGGTVSIIGPMDEVDTVLAAADLFVLPSVEEHPSAALLEAMAAGLPVVVCDSASSREVVEDDGQGLIVPPGDAEALAGALGRLMGDRELGRRLGTAARERVERDFPLAKMVAAHVTLFEELVGA